VSTSTAGGTLAGLERGFVAANQWLVIVLMATMSVLVFANVVSRYVFNASIIWVEELTQYQMIWITYLGAGLALREGRHVAVEVLQDVLPPALRRYVRWFVALAMLAFLVTLAVLGFRIVQFTWNQETPVMNIPTGVPYLGVPIGAAVMALHLVLFMRDYVDKRFEHVDPHEAEMQ
jgi:TRAP-type C4-dicarboxylate transport system permease small subunit